MARNGNAPNGVAALHDPITAIWLAGSQQVWTMRRDQCVIYSSDSVFDFTCLSAHEGVL